MLIQFSKVLKNFVRSCLMSPVLFLLVAVGAGQGNLAYAEASVKAAVPVDDSVPYSSAEDSSFNEDNASKDDEVTTDDNSFADAGIPAPSIAEEPKPQVSRSKLVAAKEDAAQFALLKKINELTQKMQQLQGQLEVQSHELQVLREQQKSFYQDLDQRLSKQSHSNVAKFTMDTRSKIVKGVDASADSLANKNVAKTEEEDNKITVAQKNPTNQPRKIVPGSAEDADENLDSTAVASNSVTAVASKPKVSKTSTDSQDELSQYQIAYKLAEQKSSEAAISAFQKFLSDFPKSQYAANAHYWLGEMFLAKKTSKAQTFALKEFKTILERYPNSPKIPSAMLKLGIVYADQGRIAAARRQFTQVKDQYPSSMAAQLADNRLQQLAILH